MTASGGTGFACIGGTALLVLLPFWFGRQLLSDLTLGTEYIDGPWFYTLTLATTWAFAVGHIADTYLRVRKWSGLFVLISLARLLLNIGLNVYLLVGLKMGIQGAVAGESDGHDPAHRCSDGGFLENSCRFSVRHWHGAAIVSIQFAARS